MLLVLVEMSLHLLPLKEQVPLINCLAKRELDYLSAVLSRECWERLCSPSFPMQSRPPKTQKIPSLAQDFGVTKQRK